MKTTVRAAIAATLFAGLCASASVAFADAPVSTPDTVLVPRIIRGADAGVIRVKSTSPEARRFFAAQGRPAQESVQSPSDRFVAAQARLQSFADAKMCPGTICVKTTDCHDTKGSLGAGCISHK